MQLLAPLNSPSTAVSTSGRSSRPPGVVRVRTWEDATGGRGVDPRSAYVERYWLPLLGAQATWLVRRLADRLEAEPDGFDLVVDEAVRTLGIWGPGGSRSAFRRALLRLMRHRFARHHGPEAVAVRRRVPILVERDVVRLPPALQGEHRRWEAARTTTTFREVRRHARRAALDLLDAELDFSSLERSLLHWGVHPALAEEVAAWAWKLREVATSAGGDQPSGSRAAQP